MEWSTEVFKLTLIFWTFDVLGLCRGKKVAIKVPKKKLTPKQIEQFKKEVIELALSRLALLTFPKIAYMSKIYHPNVVLFLGAQTKERIMIVTGTLSPYHYLSSHVYRALCHRCRTSSSQRNQVRESLWKNENGPRWLWRSSPPVFFYCQHPRPGAALGMNWLHGICNIVHRDLKPANLLIASDGTVKGAFWKGKHKFPCLPHLVTDFGFSDFFHVGTDFVERSKG